MEITFIKYNYLSKKINRLELLDLLKEHDEEEIKLLVNEVENILNNIPNEEDEDMKDFKEDTLEFIKALEDEFGNAAKEENNPMKNFIEIFKNELKDDKDNNKIYTSISNLLKENEYLIELENNLTDEELFKRLTDFWFLDVQPKITQEQFSKFIKRLSKENKTQEIFELCTNYISTDMDFTKAIDHFIKVKDVFYITEIMFLIRPNNEHIVDDTVKKLYETDDYEFMNKVAELSLNLNLTTEEEILYFKNKYSKNK